MADELIMGIDAGTSRIRVLVFEMDGTVVAQGSSEPKVDRPNPGWASTESEDLWSCCLEAMKVAVSEVAIRREYDPSRWQVSGKQLCLWTEKANRSTR